MVRLEKGLGGGMRVKKVLKRFCKGWFNDEGINGWVRKGPRDGGVQEMVYISVRGCLLITMVYVNGRGTFESGMGQ